MKSASLTTACGVFHVDDDLLSSSGGQRLFWYGRGATALYMAFRAAALTSDLPVIGSRCRNAVSTLPGQQGPTAEIILPAVSCIVPASACLAAGFTPRFADVDPETGLVSVESIQAVWSEQTRAVLFIHLYGQTADLSSLYQWCQEKNVSLIEDAALALGACLPGGQPVGSVGDMAIYSFGQTKILESGGGGALIARKTEHIEAIEREQRQLERLSVLHDQDREYLEASARQLQYALITLMRSGIDAERAAGVAESGGTVNAIWPGSVFHKLHRYYSPLYFQAISNLELIRERWPELPAELSRRCDKASVYAEQLSGGPWTLLNGWQSSGTCWRFTLLVDFPEHLIRFSDAVRADGFHVSNLYWPVHSFFNSNDQCDNALMFSRRVMNLWVDDSVDLQWVTRCAQSLHDNLAVLEPNDKR